LESLLSIFYCTCAIHRFFTEEAITQYIPTRLIKNKEYCDSLKWNLCNLKDSNPDGEIVMNYGVYKKDLFRKYGLYDSNFHFYYADGELSHRFHSHGAKFKDCAHIRVASIEGVPKASGPALYEHSKYYNLCRENHLQGRFQSHLDFLK